MTIEVRLPQFGMGMQDATVVAWYRKVGDRVEVDEPLLEIESAKTTVEVPAPASGVLTRILVQIGENVPVLAVLAEMSEGPQLIQVAEVEGVVRGTQAIPADQTSRPRATPLAVRVAQAHGVALAEVAATGHAGRICADDVRAVLSAGPAAAMTQKAVQVEPRARKRAKDQGLRLEGLAGSGPGGRVVEADVLRAIAARAAQSMSASVPAPTRAAVLPTLALPAGRRSRREIIATRMMQSLQGSAQLTLTSEVDVTALMRWRAFLKSEFNPSLTAMFVKACGLALLRHPQMNASWSEGGPRQHDQIHVGVAVALDDGLMVPVLRDVPAKSLRALAAEFEPLVQRARDGTSSSADLTGGTFSISNLGNWGIDAFTPVLNTPEAGILGLGRINERLVRDGDGMAWRQVMVLSLTFDHRVVDGVPAAQFLQTVARIVAEPEQLLT